MFAVLSSARKMMARAFSRPLACLAFVALAACEPIDLGGLGGGGQQIDPGKAVPVALLLPRGGGNSGDDLISQNLENAARLAAAELNGAQIELRVYATGGNAQTAAAQAQKAVDEGAKIILGPLRAESANAAGVAVADDGVNVLAFSNNTSIAGGNVFVLGSTFENTAGRLMGYAASKGHGNIVLVHSNDVGGTAARNAVQKAAASSGARIVGTVDYALSQQGVAQSVPRIKAAVSNGSADAVFLDATTSGALPLFATMLPEAGINPATTQYLGLSRWDIPAQSLSLPGLQGGLFVLPDPSRTAAFNGRYQAAYGSAPHPIAGIAFDAVAAVGALVARGNRDALSRSSLTQSSGFQGATGAFRLLPDGSNQRAVAVATVQNGQAVIVDAAPRSFSGF
ncbi:penicillin-binding protein activator [Aliishimia ponticola]|nr:penicillin-binding protein activator [Aliishimia ponticola]